ncbi:sensor histidine kinase [Antrihabitans spumae]|uniref:histidine kinase n=1 Tax=Antrihabitans spumae TaxID=3373370 RepID=A0ABW7K7A0_9NOCA
MRRWSDLSIAAQSAIIAVIMFVFGGMLYVAGLYPLSTKAADPSLAIRFGVLAMLCLATFARRLAPATAIIAGLIPLGIDLALGPTVPVWLIYSDLVYAVALYGTRRQSRAVVAVSIVGSVVGVCAVLAVTGDWRSVAIAVAIASAFLATPIWWALAVRTHKEIADAERARAHALTVVAELDRRAAIADERNTMARDLHDVIAGHLSAIAIQSEAALRVQESNPDSIPEILKSMRANSIGALDEMRTMIGLLRSDDVSGEITAPRRLAHLPKLVESARVAGTAVVVRNQHDDIPIPSAVDHTAYRIAQEALTNAMKHAAGQAVDMEVRVDPDQLLLTVTNAVTARNSATADLDSPRSGLRNMRERTELLGGSFAAGERAGRWCVRASLPLSSPMTPTERTGTT